MKILKEFILKLKNKYGDKLKYVILYGSFARKEANEDSDIDLAIIIKSKIRPFEEIDRMTVIACDVDLKYKVLLSLHSVSEEDYHKRFTPLLMNIREEGFLI